MTTEDSHIINLYRIIKTNKCASPGCIDEITQLEQLIEKYNVKENLRDIYWTYEYSLTKSKNNLKLVRKNIFSRYVISGKDLIEKRSY